MKFETEQDLFNHIVAHAASMGGPSIDEGGGAVTEDKTETCVSWGGLYIKRRVFSSDGGV